MTRRLLIVLIAPLLLSTAWAEEATHTSWTHTYLKAKAPGRSALRTFVETNWFAMDAVAVEQGLFKSYRLIENLASDDTEWDFIVAVEYFGDQAYADIAEPFESIRREHTTVLVDGKGFRELGAIVKSERVRHLD